jgi:hypothetical protein
MAEAGGGAGNAFLTQSKSEKISEVKKDIAELEELLSGSGKTSQSTLLLKKRKEMREVDEALELMKQEYKRRYQNTLPYTAFRAPSPRTATTSLPSSFLCL